ncbi:hypothetical protein DPMN_020224 [Dreissena polymorpha]|uniref:Uncharacterized protein n=1 Tax=Dreissena polymorpha TaxID=45954 RepID=A0A9D4NKQ4_DREPO|nr:hypothetical protein DPMN_020224 [Dreissena polymorpha]
MNTSGMVQVPILPIIVNKVLKVHPSGFVTSTSHFKPKRPRTELMLEKALQNDSSLICGPVCPLTLNTTLVRTQIRPLAISARLECRLSFLSFG